MRIFRQPHNQYRQRGVPVRILLLLIIAAILFWVLSTMNIVQGVWATVLNILFTGLGTIFALLQWHAQEHSEISSAATLPKSDKTFSYERFVQGVANKREGAILVYASRKWRGTTLHLLLGMEGNTKFIEAASNVVESDIRGQYQFLAYFPAISPGHYTLVAPSKQRRVQVTVYPGHLSEIDWR